MKREEVILVDEHDEPCGVMEKMEAHEKGLLHRAFSVFIFNERGEMLIHQRAMGKYHSGGLWTNACCSHPRPGEDTEAAAHRRLMEEMRIDCELHRQFSFMYKAGLDNGMTEHEYDHVYFGHYNDFPDPDPKEVMAWKYISPEAMAAEIEQSPENYTQWFKIALQHIRSNGFLR